MDNARIHKNPDTIELIKSRSVLCNAMYTVFVCRLLLLGSGMHVEFLPAYSPDLNPIEEAFSCIKARFRRRYPHFARTDTTGTDPDDVRETMKMLFDVVYSITSTEAYSFFAHSRYVWQR